MEKMQNIVCPSCGSEKVTILENEKAVCLACDSVFNIHNYSKEFEKTTSHIDEKTVEIIQKIENIKSVQSRSNRENEEYERLLEKAQSYIKLGDKPKAIECAQKATEVIPEKAQGYMELYRIWTNEYSLTNYYEIFLNTKETRDGSDITDALKKALRCPDCSKDFIKEVVDFQKRCAKYALSEIEAGSQKANTYIGEETAKSQEIKKSITDAQAERKKKIKKNNRITSLITALVAVVIFVTSRVLGFEGIFGIIAAVLFLLFQIVSGFRNEANRLEWIGRFILVIIVFAVVVNYFAFPIVDALGLFALAFTLVRKLNEKRKIQMSVIESAETEQINDVEKKYRKNQALYGERMKELETKKDLYNRILADADNETAGKTLLNNYLNKTYII